MDDQEHLDGAAIRARLIELMTRPDFLQAAVDALPPGADRALLRWWDAAQGFYTALSGLSIAPDPLGAAPSRSADAHDVVERLREVLSQPGVLASVRAQPRSATVDVLLWAAERLGIQG
jgi:hypothetical protein